MKKWNLLFLVIFVILFIITVIPMFQNVWFWSVVVFFGNRSARFSGIYMPLVFLSMIDWAFLTLYIQSLFRDLRRQDATKFDLSK